MSTILQPGRSSATGVTFSLSGLMNLQFDLVSQTRSGKASDGAMNLACTFEHFDEAGELTGPSTVTQQYVCDHDPKTVLIDAAMRAVAEDPGNLTALTDLQEAMAEAGHGPYSISDLGRARWVTVALDKDGNEVDTDADEHVEVVSTAERFVLADKADIVAAKVGTLDKEVIEFRVHPTEEIDALCRPGEKGYLVRPAKGKSKKITGVDENAYAALLELARQPDVALVGSLRLRDSRSVYRLGVWGNQMVLTELALPSDLRERDVIDAEPAEQTVKSLLALARGSVEPFDESLHRWDVEAAVSELVAKAKAETAEAAPAPVFNEANLDELLARALAAQGIEVGA